MLWFFVSLKIAFVLFFFHLQQAEITKVVNNKEEAAADSHDINHTKHLISITEVHKNTH